MVASIVVMISMAFESNGVYAFGSVSLKDFIDFEAYYWISLGRLIFCICMVCLGYFIGIKINRLLENE